MSDNPPPRPGHAIALPDHRVLALCGRDATAFAHAQFMSDVATLAPGQWQWGGWLTPKGRVLALFALLKLDPETLWLVLPDADPAVLAVELQRFVFRSRIVIAPRDDLVVTGSFAKPARAVGSQLSGDATTQVELDVGGDGGARTLRVGDGHDALHSPGYPDGWAAFDLAHGLPRLPGSQAGQWTPQQLSLDRLRAYSIRKGCYPGQEIVARTHFLGQAKRGLALFDADATVPVGSDVRDGDRVIGSVVSAASDVGSHRALAVLPLDREAAILHAEGVVLNQRPLLGGLAR